MLTEMNTKLSTIVKIYFLAMIIAICSSSCSNKQATEDVTTYLSREEVADSRIVLPEPPAPGTLEFTVDSMSDFKKARNDVGHALHQPHRQSIFESQILPLVFAAMADFK